MINRRQRHEDATRVGSTTRGVSDRAPVQRNAFRQRPCLVLAEDRCGSHIKTSLVDYCLRQLHLATRKHPSVSPSATCNVRDATGMAGCALSRCRSIRRFELRAIDMMSARMCLVSVAAGMASEV